MSKLSVAGRESELTCKLMSMSKITYIKNELHPGCVCPAGDARTGLGCFTALGQLYKSSLVKRECFLSWINLMSFDL